MKKTIVSLFLAFCLTLISCFTVLADNNINSAGANHSEEIIAEVVSENDELLLSESEKQDIRNLSSEQIDTLFSEAFDESAENYSQEEKTTALISIATVNKFSQATSTNRTRSSEDSYMGDLDSYYGGVGVSWVRDIRSGKSPLKLLEALSGTYILEVDYLTFAETAAIAFASLEEDNFALFVNSGAPSIITTIITTAMNLDPKAVITATTISTIVSAGWAKVSSMDSEAFAQATGEMKLTDMLRVSFNTTNNSTITKAYSVYTPKASVYDDSTDFYRYYDIKSPTPEKYGFWKPNEIGILRSY